MTTPVYRRWGKDLGGDQLVGLFVHTRRAEDWIEEQENPHDYYIPADIANYPSERAMSAATQDALPNRLRRGGTEQ